MVCYVASEIRMHRDSEGRIRAKHPAAAHAVWGPFVDAFGSIVILARVDEADVDDTGVLVAGNGVTVQPLPYYTGARATLRGLLRVRRALRIVGSASDIFIGRVPELVTFAVLSRAHELRARNVVLLASDPRSLRSLFPAPFGPLVAAALTRWSRHALRHADAVSYVSERYFQTVFPAPSEVPTIGRSNVLLPDAWVVTGAREASTGGALRLISVGTLEHEAKGMDFLLDVVAELGRRGVATKLTIVGEGRLRAKLERIAAARNLEVVFTGQIEDKADLRELLDDADVYVSGSRSEGLPRATVEAMARALPVVTTNVGAACELVDEPFLTPIDGLHECCAALMILAQNAVVYREQSAASLATATRVSEAARPGRLTAFLKEHVVDDGRA